MPNNYRLLVGKDAVPTLIEILCKRIPLKFRLFEQSKGTFTESINKQQSIVEFHNVLWKLNFRIQGNTEDNVRNI